LNNAFQTVSGIGSAGSYFDTSKWSFPAVPYSYDDFNDENCYSGNGGIENYHDVNQVIIIVSGRKHTKFYVFWSQQMEQLASFCKFY